MDDDERRDLLIDAYSVGVDLSERLRDGESLSEALHAVDGPFGMLEDGYPDWHPAPYDFPRVVTLFLYREITGQSYRDLAQHPELAEVFGLVRIPDKSVLSRAWRQRFSESEREFVTTAAHYVVKEIHNRDMSVPAARPKQEVVTPGCDLSAVDDGEDPDETTEQSDTSFDDEAITRTTRLARQHGFEGFDSERAQNATYGDTQFFELQTFMGMVGCGTAQGAARFQHRRGREYAPHGDTHLRAVKQFEPEDLRAGFDEATNKLLSVISSEATFRRSVTVAIDITTIPYYDNTEGMSMVSSLTPEDRAYKFATLSIVGYNVPLVLAVEPIHESSAWDENPSNQVHRAVRRLVRRAKDHVPIGTVLCDREFDSKQAFQTLENLDVNYLIPKRIHSTEREVIDQMEADDQEVAVESARVDIEAGSHPMRFLYVPWTKGEGTAVFATNLRSVPTRRKHSADGTAGAGRSKTSTRASRATSLRRPPRRTTASGCFTSCSR